jgi:hypothetical protein
MASTIKVNNIQNQCGANIANKCGTTITLGASGDTITLACGASQTGFGRTGTVDWDTTAKTASFTAVSGNGYFVNTTSGAVTLTLPASPSAGDIVGFNDYARTFATNNLTVARNGSNIQGAAVDGTIATNGQSTMFVYVDGTQGWVPTEDQTTGSYGAEYIVATGGTITCCGDYKIHTFTGPGTFTVCSVGNAAGSNTVSYLVVAGGGEGGSTAPSNGGGGGGAGGYREGKASSDCYTASPIASTTGLPVSAQGYPITVGGGGAQQCNPANNLGNPGSNSVFSTITSAGGGGGKIDSPAGEPGTAGDGGSGGGGSAAGAPVAPTRNPGGSGNTPPVSPSQGNDGGIGGPSSDSNHGGGGGGGATGVGGNTVPGTNAGTGGVGATTNITGSPVAYAGGGGGGATGGSASNRGAASPCGTGGQGGAFPNIDGSAGTTNRGGGGGSGGWPAAGTARGGGGSGIVIIRYKYQ